MPSNVPSFPESIQSSDGTTSYTLRLKKNRLALYQGDNDEKSYIVKEIPKYLQNRAELLKKAQQGSHHTARIKDVINIENATNSLILSEFVYRNGRPECSATSWNDGAESLDSRIRAKGRLMIWEAWGIISQVADVIYWFATHGGHGDIRPQNILLRDDNEVVVVDLVNPIASSSADNSLSRPTPDLRALVELLLYILGCLESWGNNSQLNGPDWHNFAKDKIGKRFSRSRFDREQLENAIAEIANHPQDSAKAVEGFLTQLRLAPGISPLPVPFSIGFVLVQSAWLGLLGGVFITMGLILQPLRLTQWWPPQIALVTPITNVTASPTATATSSVTAQTPAITATLSPPFTVTATTSAQITPSPTIANIPSAVTKTPTPRVRPPLTPTWTPTLSPTPTSFVPQGCIENDQALSEGDPPFGFDQPKSGADFNVQSGFRVRVGDYDYYTIRYAMQGQEKSDWEMGKKVTNIIYWASIDRDDVCQKTPEGPRCQRSVDVSQLHQGILNVEWRDWRTDGIEENRNYTLLLELERGNKHECAYISSVRFKKPQ